MDTLIFSRAIQKYIRRCCSLKFFIISTCLSKVLTINFLEDGNRYKVEIFSVYLLFNELSKNISHFVVAQNFVISTCLSKVLTINFLEEYNTYRAEIFSVHLYFNKLSNDISHVAVA